MISNIKSIKSAKSLGPFLKINQSEIIEDIKLKTFGVLDFFGGSGIGDKWSRETKESVLNRMEVSTQDLDSTLPYFFDSNYQIETNVLANILLNTNETLIEYNRDKDLNKRVGASAALLYINNNRVYVAAIGNIAIFLNRNCRTSVLNQIHSHVSHGVHKSMFELFPIQYLGRNDSIRMSLIEQEVMAKDRIYCANVGAYSLLSINELNDQFLSNFDNNDILNTIFRTCNDRGNKGNQSGMILNF